MHERKRHISHCIAILALSGGGGGMGEKGGRGAYVLGRGGRGK